MPPDIERAPDEAGAEEEPPSLRRVATALAVTFVAMSGCVLLFFTHVSHAVECRCVDGMLVTTAASGWFSDDARICAPLCGRRGPGVPVKIGR